MKLKYLATLLVVALWHIPAFAQTQQPLTYQSMTLAFNGAPASNFSCQIYQTAINIQNGQTYVCNLGVFVAVSSSGLPGGGSVGQAVINTSPGAGTWGAVGVAGGGTGVATLTGIVKGNGTSPFSAAAASDIFGLWTGTCNNTTFLRGDGACGGALFSSTVGGTNTTAAMVVGTGASLAVSGTGTIGATSLGTGTSLTGSVLTGVNAGNATFTPVGLADRDVAGTSDTILCDSATATRDRGSTIRYTAGTAIAVTMPDAGTSGCGNNFTVDLAADGAGTVTVSRTSASTFDVVNGAQHLSAQTSFQLTPGQSVRISSPDNANWYAKISGFAASLIGPGVDYGTFTGGPIYGISTATESSVTVTITTTAPCLYTSGMVVNISGVNVAGYNGNFMVVAGCSGGSTFTYYDQTGLGAGTGGTATGAPVHSSGLTVTGLLVTGTALPVVLPVNPINLGNYCSYTALPYGINSPCTTTSLNLGAPPVANGTGFASAHRNDIQTAAGYDVVTGAAAVDSMTCQGTNAGGTQTDNATNCVAIFGNASSFGTSGSVNPIASDFYAISQFTGTGTHLVQSMQNLLKTARTPGWFGDTANDYSPMNTFNIASGSQNISAFLGMTSSAAGKGAKTGAFITDTIDTADAIWHGANIARPTTGRWCAASIVACEFFGAGAGYSTLQANAPLYSDSPYAGAIYGEAAANSGASLPEVFYSTNAGTVCTPLASPNGASEVGNVITITCNAAISGDFAAPVAGIGPVSVAHITGMGVTGYNIDCPIQSVASPSFTCIDSNITTSGFTITGASESAGTVTITTSATCPFTTGETVTIANVVNGSPLTNNGYNGAFTVLTPGCNGGSTFTYTNAVTGLPTCSTGPTCAGPINASAIATGNPLPASGGGSVTASTRAAFGSQFDSAGVHHFSYSQPPSATPTNKINFTMGSAAVTQQTLVSSTVTAIMSAVAAGAVQMGANSAHRTDILYNGNPATSFDNATMYSNTAGAINIGKVANPFASLFLGTAATNNFNFVPTATTGARTISIPDFGVSAATTQIFPSTAVLTSQYTNSTTGFTNVAGGATLAFPVAANTAYTAICHLYYQAASTGGLNIEFTGPASPTAVHYGLLLPVTTGTAPLSTEADAYSASLGAVIGTAATNFDATVSFGLVNGANAGTVNLLAKSSAAVQLQIQIGSFCKIE